LGLEAKSCYREREKKLLSSAPKHFRNVEKWFSGKSLRCAKFFAKAWF
jgi:hypothetical protein